jgi:ribosomal protein S18 acetylase RimI-like enzyme
LFNKVLSVLVLGELPGSRPGSGLGLQFRKQTVQHDNDNALVIFSGGSETITCMQQYSNMKLVDSIESDIEELMAWFGDEESLRRWGGPFVDYPFTPESFTKDICWQDVASLSTHDDSGRLLGFGQYYSRFNRCHLARLAISPNHRGAGFGQAFISKLIQMATADTGLSQCSLYVLDDNDAALGCYKALGFTQAPDPEGTPVIWNCIYMLRETPTA